MYVIVLVFVLFILFVIYLNSLQFARLLMYLCCDKRNIFRELHPQRYF